MKVKIPIIDFITDSYTSDNPIVRSDCADITFVNQSATIVGGIVTAADDVIISGRLLRYGDSFTDSAFGNEINTKTYSIKWLTSTSAANKRVDVTRKFYKSFREVEQ